MLIAKYYISLLELHIKYAAECTTDIKCPIYPFLVKKPILYLLKTTKNQRFLILHNLHLVYFSLLNNWRPVKKIYKGCWKNVYNKTWFTWYGILSLFLISIL